MNLNLIFIFFILCFNPKNMLWIFISLFFSLIQIIYWRITSPFPEKYKNLLLEMSGFLQMWLVILSISFHENLNYKWWIICLLLVIIFTFYFIIYYQSFMKMKIKIFGRRLCVTRNAETQTDNFYNENVNNSQLSENCYHERRNWRNFNISF